MMNKKEISVTECAIEQITEYSHLKNILIVVERLIEKYGSDAYVEFDSGYSNISESITYKRLETDKEYAQRLKQESREKEKSSKKEIEERKEYERLKRKYGA